MEAAATLKRRRVTGLRWWIIALVMTGTALNFLTRATLGVAAPTLMADLAISAWHYSWITSAFQLGIMMQPAAGYLLDRIGLRGGLAAFALAWGLITMAHGLAGSWQGLAALRGALGFAEGSGHPGGLKVVAEYFPARERGFATGIYNIGASLGGVLAPPLVVWAIWTWNWRAAFLVSGSFALVWAGVWLLCYRPRAEHPALGAEERAHIESGQEPYLDAADERPSIRSILGQRNFWGIALPRFLADPTWGTLIFWMPLYLSTARGFNLGQIALTAWLPFVAADLGCLFGPFVALILQRRGMDLITARKCAFTLGALLMTGMMFVGSVESAVAAVALLCLGGFAHQVLSITVITMASDLFRKHEIGTVAGSAGLFANLGVLLFSLAIGGLVARIGYPPFFVALGLLDLLGAALLWALVRAPGEAGVIRNPILPGFNPDPSIVRVGGDYYVATSTFEWFPGVQIHHSRDLVHWRLLTHPLTRPSQIDMRGNPDSCGVWAPCLSWADGLFHLVYTDVKRYGRSSGAGAPGASLRDFHNYLVTSPTIDGQWSDPIRLNSSGFDPSLFHDEDGRKYLVNMLWDHRPGRNRFGGIVLQEYSPTVRALVGERRLIFTGTPLGFTEAPHLYRRHGFYYLITAEGGTGWDHAVTMARSPGLEGPWELHPDTHILSARGRPDLPLQRAGHADLVETRDGDTWMVYLCGRPLPNRGRCILGRETAIQPMRWADDGWLYTINGDAMPTLETPAPALPPAPFDLDPEREDFDGPALPIAFQWLRTPVPEEIFSLADRPGHLRLIGRETIGSLFTQALVARRQQAFCYSAKAMMDFTPDHYQHAAGLVCYYGGAKFHYLFVSQDEETGRHIGTMSALPDSLQGDSFTRPVSIPPGRIELRAEVDFERLLFGWRVEGQEAWTWLAEPLDASLLSDEASAPGQPNFTGAFVGMACQDLAGTGRAADFDWFDYREREYCADPTSG